ncbi:hypothetical protein KY345_02460 [Candidatus Woesearchaeota archaeon]|nr:hypothetical protein [Candidatus Woesearchaeota archaeon]
MDKKEMERTSVRYLLEGAILAAKEGVREEDNPDYASLLEKKAIEYAVEKDGKLTAEQYKYIFNCIHWLLYSSSGDYKQKQRIAPVGGRKDDDPRFWRLLNPSEFFDKSGKPRQDFGKRIEGLAACIQKYHGGWLSARYGGQMGK